MVKSKCSMLGTAYHHDGAHSNRSFVADCSTLQSFLCFRLANVTCGASGECAVCREKGADRSGVIKLKKRSYFKCYNKSCSAKMVVDLDIETGKELAPFLSGAHSHTFEIAPTGVEE